MCSAVQNQDFTIVQDYITGLKALLYMNGRDVDGVVTERPEGCRPSPALVKDTLDLSDDYDVIASADRGDGAQTFGPYLREMRHAQATEAAARMFGVTKESKELKDSKGSVSVSTEKGRGVGGVPQTATPVERAVGRLLKNVGAYKSLDRRAQVVALVNEVGLFHTVVPFLVL